MLDIISCNPTRPAAARLLKGLLEEVDQEVVRKAKIHLHHDVALQSRREKRGKVQTPGVQRERGLNPGAGLTSR